MENNNYFNEVLGRNVTNANDESMLNLFASDFEDFELDNAVQEQISSPSISDEDVFDDYDSYVFDGEQKSEPLFSHKDCEAANNSVPINTSLPVIRLDVMLNNYSESACRSEYLIDPIVRQNSLVIISAGSKCKKTFLIEQEALCISSGMSFLGKAVKKRRVLFIDPELKQSAFSERIIGLSNAIPLLDMGEALKNMDVITLRSIDKTDFFDELENYLFDQRQRGIEYGAIFIDSLYMFLNGDENSSSTMMNIMNQLIHIADRFAAVTTTMHVSKSTAAGQSGYETVDRAAGSGVSGRAADSIWAISKCDSANSDKEYYKIDSALREDKTPEPIYIEIDKSGAMPVHRVIDDAGSLGLTQHNSKNTSRAENN